MTVRLSACVLSETLGPDDAEGTEKFCLTF